MPKTIAELLNWQSLRRQPSFVGPADTIGGPQNVTSQFPGTAPGLLIPGNILDIYNRPTLQNSNNSWSTTSSMSFKDNQGREVLIPTVINGTRLSPLAAWNVYRKTGRHLGIFDNPQNADAYAQALHMSQQEIDKWVPGSRRYQSR